MTFLTKVKQVSFWGNVAKISIPFFCVLMIFSIVFNNWSAIFSGNFDTISNKSFTNGKWKFFIGSKLIISLLYGMYITSKNTK